MCWRSVPRSHRHGELEERPTEPGAGETVGSHPPNSGGTLPTADGDGEYEEFQIGDRYVRLPKENLAKEWELLKATVDAFVDRLASEETDG